MGGGNIVSLRDHRLLKAWNDPHRPFTAAEYVAFAKSADQSGGPQSTAAGTDRRDNSTEDDPAPAVLDPEAAATPPAGVAPPVDTSSEPPVLAPADQAWSGDAARKDASLAAPINTAASNALKLRPNCLSANNLSKCAGQGRKHCYACLKALADSDGVSA